MRDDMYKVIVESPRSGSRMRTRDGRIFRESEDAPFKLGMKKGYGNRKYLNENLSPLKRWLQSQVNRPWTNVYAEICANIDRRNTVQEHIFSHIGDFVERNTSLREGRVGYFSSWGGKWSDISESYAEMYVHPATGILLANRRRKTWRKVRDENRARAVAEERTVRRDLGEFEQLHRLEGVWFHVVLESIALPVKRDGDLHYPRHWDVVSKREVSRDPNSVKTLQQLEKQYGKWSAFAVRKRQLSSAELKKYRLTNEDAGAAGVFFGCNAMPLQADHRWRNRTVSAGLRSRLC